MEKQINIPRLRFPDFTGEWEVKKLGEVAKKVNSGKTPLGGQSVYTEKGVLFIRSQNINNNQLELDNPTFIPEEINKEMKNSIVKPNDILLNITGASLGRSCVVPENFSLGNVNQHVCIIRLRTENNPRFLQPILSSQKGQNIFSSLQTGSGREGLNFESIKSIELSFPSLPEQQKIATFLTATDDKLQALKKKKALLEQYKKGVMQKLFSQKLRFKDENGGDFPEWEERKLSDLIRLQGGFAFKSKEFKTKGIPVIRISNISNDNNYINLSNVVYYDKINNAQKFTIEKWDLIIAMSGATTGKSSIYNLDEIAYLNQRVGLFRPIEKSLYYGFLIQFVFSDLFKQQLEAFLVAGAQPNISSSDIERISLSYPSSNEQSKIATFLSTLDEKINQVAEQIAQTATWKKGLLQKMFI